MEVNQELYAVIKRLQTKGISLGQMHKQIELALCSVYAPGLLPEQLDALHSPTGRTSVEIIERLECECLNKTNNLEPVTGDFTHFNGNDKANNKTKRRTVMYMQDYECNAFFSAVSDKSYMLNLTNHNAGYDLIRFCDWNPEKMTARGVFVQQKIGNTPLNNAKSESNANRSATFISSKLKDAANDLKKTIARLFGVTLKVDLQVHTTSGVNASARKEFDRNEIELLDATDLWDEVWTQTVKSALITLHGKQKAIGFGRVL